jgi:hypothetical protein
MPADRSKVLFQYGKKFTISDDNAVLAVSVLGIFIILYCCVEVLVERRRRRRQEHG